VFLQYITACFWLPLWELDGVLGAKRHDLPVFWGWFWVRFVVLKKF
jgi:hypothetical protein